MTEANSTRDNSAILAEQNLSLGKLFLLGVFGIVLSSFGPMSLFASVPLAMAILLFGRPKAFVMVSVLATLLIALNIQFQLTPYLGLIFLVSYGYAVLVSEIFLRNIHPVRGLLLTGAVVMAILFGLVILTIASGVDLHSQLKTLVVQTLEVVRENNSELLAQKGAEARMLEDVLNNPDEVVKNIINWSPATIFVSNYFVLWASMFILLRNSLFWRIKYAYSYSAKELVRFKMPDAMVWPFIFSLALTVAGSYLGEKAEVLGNNLLYCFGVFYFFQGFGIYLDFLSFAKIRGIFRSLLVIFTVTMAWKLIAVVGVFDFWVNFRKFFKNNENKDIN